MAHEWIGDYWLPSLGLSQYKVRYTQTLHSLSQGRGLLVYKGHLLGVLKIEGNLQLGLGPRVRARARYLIRGISFSMRQ